MTGEYIEQRNDGYYIAGTRISLDSVVYSFDRRNSPEAIQKEFPVLRLAQIYGAVAFYLDHQAEVRQYLENEERRIQEVAVPLQEVQSGALEPAAARPRTFEQVTAVSVRSLADADLNFAIVQGVRLHEPAIDFKGANLPSPGVLLALPSASVAELSSPCS